MRHVSIFDMFILTQGAFSAHQIAANGKSFMQLNWWQGLRSKVKTSQAGLYFSGTDSDLKVYDYGCGSCVSVHTVVPSAVSPAPLKACQSLLVALLVSGCRNRGKFHVNSLCWWNNVQQMWLCQWTDCVTATNQNIPWWIVLMDITLNHQWVIPPKKNWLSSSRYILIDQAHVSNVWFDSSYLKFPPNFYLHKKQITMYRNNPNDQSARSRFLYTVLQLIDSWIIQGIQTLFVWLLCWDPFTLGDPSGSHCPWR